MSPQIPGVSGTHFSLMAGAELDRKFHNLQQDRFGGRFRGNVLTPQTFATPIQISCHHPLCFHSSIPCFLYFCLSAQEDCSLPWSSSHWHILSQASGSDRRACQWLGKDWGCSLVSGGESDSTLFDVWVLFFLIDLYCLLFSLHIFALRCLFAHLINLLLSLLLTPSAMYSQGPLHWNFEFGRGDNCNQHVRLCLT